MPKSFTLKLESQSPIEIVYGLKAASLAEIKSKHNDIRGYDWVSFLDEFAEQREVFLSGVDIDDAILHVFDGDSQIHKIKFDIDYELQDHEPEEGIQFVGYDPDIQIAAGYELNLEGIDHIVTLSLELKYRDWKSSVTLSEPFSPEKLSVTMKSSDSVHEVADVIYNQWGKMFETSLVELAYDGKPVEFEVDYTSYPPEFFCLKRVAQGWERNKKLEDFFNQDE